MSLFGSLKGAATRIGLLRVVTLGDADQPQKIATRTISLQELATEERAAEVQALAAAPAELNVALEQVFLASGIKTPEHGWSMDKLQELVSTEPYKSMTREKAQPALLTLLASQKVPVEDLVKDAMARDKALDSYTAHISEKRQLHAAAQSHKATELRNQIAELKDQLERLESQAALEERQWNDWRGRKRAAEKQMAAAISYLLKDPIISIDDDPPQEHNSQ